MNELAHVLTLVILRPRSGKCFTELRFSWSHWSAVQVVPRGESLPRSLRWAFSPLLSNPSVVRSWSIPTGPWPGLPPRKVWSITSQRREESPWVRDIPLFGLDRDPWRERNRQRPAGRNRGSGSLGFTWHDACPGKVPWLFESRGSTTTSPAWSRTPMGHTTSTSVPRRL